MFMFHIKKFLKLKLRLTVGVTYTTTRVMFGVLRFGRWFVSDHVHRNNPF